jgi:predicted transcriptional regulator of viral defense system
MKNSMENNLRKLQRPYLSDTELATLLDGTADSRYSKVKRLLAQGKLLHIRRGLYCLTEAIGYLGQQHPYELAQHIYGPSYISLESALSFHQLIPERVYTITCVSTKRAKEFQTPLGVFNYLRLPAVDFYTEVELINENKHPFLIAKPWKAICDYIYCYKKDWISLKPLIHSLRIEPDNLPELRSEEMQLLNDYYRHNRISRFLKSLINER